eukprot:13053621-Alexandrium_andersonii.AAC.1
MREKPHRTHPSGASGTHFDAVLGPAQFQVRTLGAMLHVLQGGLQIEADCSTGRPQADCGLHFGHLAM